MISKIFTSVALILISSQLYAQNITNTLGSNGYFYVKSISDTMLVLKQSNGFLGLGVIPSHQLEISGNFSLANTSDSLRGVIYKNNIRFIHNFAPQNSFGENTFVGENSGNFNLFAYDYPEGSLNTGIGSNTLKNLQRGFYNCAVGSNALSNLTNGNLNTAVGRSSQSNSTTGNGNTSVGNVSLSNNSTGSFNVAIGSSALSLNTTGNYNTVLGSNAANILINGSNNIIIGNNSQPSTGSTSNQITIGDNQITSFRCNVQSLTSLSDRRDKKNISDLSLGLDFISRLKPRQFNWDKREWYDSNLSDGSKTEYKLNAGFIAQELDEVQSEENADWLGLVNKDNPDKIEATYGNLLPVMVKAIQELNQKIEKLKSENENLKAEIISMNDIKDRLIRLEKLQSEFTKEIDLIQNREQNSKSIIVENKIK